MQSEVDLFSDSLRQVVEWLPGDESLPGGLQSINLTLNRKRLAEFLDRFQTDSDLRDFLMLDVLAAAIGAKISSTGEEEEVSELALRPFRLWEYVWLYKVLELSEPRKRVLDLGGPASHLLILATLAGNQTRSLDINPRIVEAGRNCAEQFRLDDYRADVGDMRDLSTITSNSVDRILCCSVLEHLTGLDQKRALSEMARVLAPGGVIGLTFDYGRPAPGMNIYLPAPHEPPETAGEVRDRYVHSGLEIVGDAQLDDPLGGSLFRTQDVSYTIGALFLGKPPLRQPIAPGPVHRKHSLIPYIPTPHLVLGLQNKARGDRSRLERMKAAEQSAQERLIALENSHAELGRLYAELVLREEQLLKLTARNEELERSWSAAAAALEQAARERLDALQSAHAELNRLYSELKNREAALFELQARISSLEQLKAALESELGQSRSDSD
jgi:SAM-dependent methyltransferase